MAIGMPNDLSAATCIILFLYNRPDSKHTVAKNGVTIAPRRAIPEQLPTPMARIVVGYTSGVYTYAAWKAPLMKPRAMNKNRVIVNL